MGTEFRALPPAVIARAWPRWWENQERDGTGAANKEMRVTGDGVVVPVHRMTPPDEEAQEVAAGWSSWSDTPGWRPCDPETRQPVDWDVVERAAGVEFRPGVPEERLLRAHVPRGGKWQLRGCSDETVGVVIVEGIQELFGSYVVGSIASPPREVQWPLTWTTDEREAGWRPVTPTGEPVRWADLEQRSEPRGVLVPAGSSDRAEVGAFARGWRELRASLHAPLAPIVIQENPVEPVPFTSLGPAWEELARRAVDVGWSGAGGFWSLCEWAGVGTWDCSGPGADIGRERARLAVEGVVHQRQDQAPYRAITVLAAREHARHGGLWELEETVEVRIDGRAYRRRFIHVGEQGHWSVCGCIDIQRQGPNSRWHGPETLTGRGRPRYLRRSHADRLASLEARARAAGWDGAGSLWGMCEWLGGAVCVYTLWPTDEEVEQTLRMAESNLASSVTIGVEVNGAVVPVANVSARRLTPSPQSTRHAAETIVLVPWRAFPSDSLAWAWQHHGPSGGRWASLATGRHDPRVSPENHHNYLLFPSWSAQDFDVLHASVEFVGESGAGRERTTPTPVTPALRQRQWRPLDAEGKPVAWDRVEALAAQHAGGYQQHLLLARRRTPEQMVAEGEPAPLRAELARLVPCGHADLDAALGVLAGTPGRAQLPESVLQELSRQWPDYSGWWVECVDIFISVRANCAATLVAGFVEEDGGDRLGDRVVRAARTAVVRCLVERRANPPTDTSSRWSALDVGPDRPAAPAPAPEPRRAPLSPDDLDPAADPGKVVAEWRRRRGELRASAEALSARVLPRPEPQAPPSRFELLEPDEAADPRVAMLEHRAKQEHARQLEAELRQKARQVRTVPAPVRRPPFPVEDATLVETGASAFWGLLAKAHNPGC